MVLGLAVLKKSESAMNVISLATLYVQRQLKNFMAHNMAFRCSVA